jgi:uncharacterized protein (TIGR03000 family)
MPYSSGQPYVSGYYDPRSGTVQTWSNVTDSTGQPVTSPSSGASAGTLPMPITRSIGEAPATIQVSLPADASLSIGGEKTQSTSGDRTFVSPPLQPGKTYFYTLKAEMDRKGEKVTASQDVEVRAGEVSRVSLQFPEEPKR